MSLTLIHGDKRYIIAAAEAAKALTHDRAAQSLRRGRIRTGEWLRDAMIA